MDPSAQHPEPFGEALSHSSQRVTQLTSLVAAAAEVAIRLHAARAARQAAQDTQARHALEEQQRTAHAQARARWAPACDARWLAQADLLQAAGTWGAATPWAGTDPAAAAAMHKSEERLRTLHPFAMTRYDRLRSQGAGPLDAMREATPMFGLHPHARPAHSRQRPEIEAPAAGTDPGPWTADGSVRQPEPGPHHEECAHAAADRRTAAQLAAESFPRTAADGIRAAAAGRLHQPGQSPARTAAVMSAGRAVTA